jgi:hypothetical protein
MNSYKKISMWLTGFVAGAAVIVAVFFQNCASGFDANDAGDAFLANAASSAPQTSAASFAFDVGFDQISYMSCFSGDANHDAFYTLKAGGYDNGGIKVSDSFMTYAKSVVPATYPNSQPTIEQLKLFLSQTPANIGATPQMAVRERDDLHLVWHLGSGNEVFGTDFVNITTDPTDDRIMDPLIRYPGYINYFAMAPSGYRKFEQLLSFNTNEQAADSFRVDTGSRGMLSLTYSDQAQSSLPRGLGTDPSKAYGRGYFLSFVQAGSNPYGLSYEAVLSSVRESNLTTGSPGSAWTCPANYQIKIYRAADRIQCATDPIGYMSDQNYRKKMEQVRRHLKAEYWDVSIINNCAVPKRGECYPSDVNTSGVEYDPAAACYNGIQFHNNAYSGAAPVKWCAQYVSFCFKN